MINKNTVARVIQANLPEADKESVEKIVFDVVQDMEAIMNSLIRQRVAQEKIQLYRQKIPNGNL